MELFDAFLPIGKTNTLAKDLPATEDQTLAVMDRIGVAEAMVYHTVARDSDPELGNAQLANLKSKRLHKIWAFDPACVIPETTAQFLKRAITGGAKAIMINPLSRSLRVDRTIRILEMAKLLEKRRIPLLLVYRAWHTVEDQVDWYQVADLCNKFPKLPVLVWEYRTRANRPMLDALALTKNLYVSLSSIWQAQMLETICDHFGPRLVFSMGLPNLDPTSFIGVMSYAPISEKIRHAVSCGTIRSLLNKANYHGK
jgi:predicted TIM-barrel fold metal-dependent hydrolase